MLTRDARNEATESIYRLGSSHPSPHQEVTKLRARSIQRRLLQRRGQRQRLFLQALELIQRLDLLALEKSTGWRTVLLTSTLRTEHAQRILQELVTDPDRPNPVMLMKAARFILRQLLAGNCRSQDPCVLRVLPRNRNQCSCRAVGADSTRLHLSRYFLGKNPHHFEPISHPLLAAAETPRERVEARSPHLHQFADQKALFPGGEPAGRHSHPELQKCLLGTQVEDQSPDEILLEALEGFHPTMPVDDHVMA